MWLSFLLIALVLFLLYRLIDFWIIKPWTIHRHLWKQGIPGEYRPILGGLLCRREQNLAGDPKAGSREMSSKYGDYYHTSFGPKAHLIISDPFLIDSVLKSNAHLYPKAEMEQIIIGSTLGYDNIMLAEGDAHRRRRRLIGPVFQHKNITSMTSLMEEITRGFLQKWTTTIRDNPDAPLTIDMHKEMSNLALNIVTGCIFGTDCTEDHNINETILQNMNTIMREIEKRLYNMVGLIPIINQLPLPGKRRIDQARQNIKQVVQQIVNQRRKGLTKSACKGPDLLDLLLMANGDETTQKFTDEEVSDEAITFILAGHETTSTWITWTLCNLATHPDIYHQCQKEVDSILVDGNEELNISSISLLTYTEAVLKEALRFQPPLSSLYRTAIQDNIIVASDGKQIHVKKGTDVVVSLNTFHRSEKFWKEPNTFDPSRFDGRSLEKLLAFAIGPRACIAQNFATVETKIILALIIKHFNFELVPGQKLVPDVVVTTRPKYGMWMRLSPR